MLYFELKTAGLNVEKEIPMPLVYKSVYLNQGYRIDLLVERQIVIELKSVSALAPIHIAQILTYMRLGKYPLGLLINFNSRLLKNGIKRLII